MLRIFKHARNIYESKTSQKLILGAHEMKLNTPMTPLRDINPLRLGAIVISVM